MNLAIMMASRRSTMCENFLKNLSWQERKPELVVIVVNKCPDYPENIADKIKALGIPEALVIMPEDSLNYAQVCNYGFTEAAVRLQTGIVTKWDDDDRYGPTYLARIEEGLAKAPESAIIGVYDVNTHWLYGDFKKGLYLAPDAPPYPHQVSSVCGPTISINIEKWLSWPQFRYDHKVVDIYADQSLFHSLVPYGGIVSTIASGDFFYQRYPASHGHGWAQPDPVE